MELYFQARIEDHYELTREDLQEYCDLNNINLEHKNTRLYNVKEKAREWKSAIIRNEIFNQIEGAQRSEINNWVLIPKSESKNFYQKFKNKNYIDWMSLSSEINLDWTPFILDDGKDLWDWETLIDNKGIPWNFSLIDIHKERLNWHIFLH